ncbi:MAG: metal-dependent hydrolase [Verrucomicrobiota bacterium]
MIFAHAAIAVIGAHNLVQKDQRPAAITFAIGSVLPDLDLFWWFFVDQQTPHHLLWPHLPPVWIYMASIALVASRLALWRRPAAAGAVKAFFAGVAIHLALDIHAGGIALLWPWSDRLFYLFPVPNTFGNFVISGVLHWTFLLEIPILFAAGMILWRTMLKPTQLFFRRRSKNPV